MLKGRGVFLRPARDDDFAEWSALREASAAYLKQVDPGWRGAAEWSHATFAGRMLASEQAMRDGRGCTLLIFRTDGKMVGGLNLGPIVGTSAGLGTWIAAAYSGRGYAIRAASAAIAFAFDRLAVEHVEATALPDNMASLRVLRFLGFRELAGKQVTMTVDGARRRHLIFRLNKCQA